MKFYKIRQGFIGLSRAVLDRLPQGLKRPGEETAAQALMIFTAGVLLAAAVSLAVKDQERLTALVRGEDAEEVSWETLEVVRENGEAVEITVEVPGRTYSRREAEQWIRHAERILERDMLGDNKSLRQVSHSLHLMTAIEGTPVSVSWISSRPDVLDWEGRIGEQVSEKGSAVTLYASMSCQGISKEREFSLMVYPEQTQGEQAWVRQLQQELKAVNDHAGQTEYVLPEQLRGERLYWRREQSEPALVILAVTLICAALWVWGKGQGEKREQQKRREQLMTDYPQILNKFLLLLGAGLNTRMAFARLAQDYKRVKSLQERKTEERAAYEEILAVYREMEQGVPEAEAYSHLGLRCALPAYRTFSTLLVQNLRKGSREIFDVLEREADEAFENRKRRAKVLGEQAGTKLLLPMGMMLILVFVILLVPACMSFL